MTSMRDTSSIAQIASKPTPANAPQTSLIDAPSTSTRTRVLKSPGIWRPRMPSE